MSLLVLPVPISPRFFIRLISNHNQSNQNHNNGLSHYSAARNSNRSFIPITSKSTALNFQQQKQSSPD